MESFNSDSKSPISDNNMDERKANGSNRTSSTPVCRPPRESLARIKKNTVSGMVNRFKQMIELTSTEIDDRNKKIGPIGRQVSFHTDFSTIHEASETVVDSKLNSVDSGYGSFRQRSRSVNSSSAINASKAVLARYEKLPNFKFSQLKYFGVDPKKYLSTFGIDYDPVSDSVRADSSDGEADNGDGGSVANISSNLSMMRKRSQTLSSKRKFDSTSATRVSNLKYFGAEPTGKNDAMKNGPIKVAAAIDCKDYEDVFSAKVGRKKTLRSVAAQTSRERKFESVDSVVAAAQRSKQKSVDRDLISGIQQSIKSYDNVLKSLRTNGIRKKKKSAGSEAK